MPETKRDTAPWFVVALVIGAVLAYLTYFFSFELPNSGSIGERVSRLDVWLVSVGWSTHPAPGPEAVKKILQVEWTGKRFHVSILTALLFATSVASGQLLLWLVGFGDPHESARKNEPTSDTAAEYSHRGLTEAERLVFAYGVGISALSLATLGLGLAGWLNRTAVLIGITALCCVGAVLEIRRRKARSFERRGPDPGLTISAVAARSPVATRGRLIAQIVGGLAMAMFLAVSFLGAMLPATDFDVREYHLQAPKEFYLGGRVPFLPHNVYANMPLGTEMISLLGMVVAGDWWWGALVGQTVLATFAPMTSIGVYSLGRRLFCRETGWFAALIYLTTPWVYRISIIPYTENALCFFLLTGTLAAVLAVQRCAVGKSPKLWWLAGAMAGSAVACKYPALISTVLPLGLVSLVAPLASRAKPSPSHPLAPTPPLVEMNWSQRISRTPVVTFALGVALTFGPWLAKNWVMTGNPMYPLLYGVFGGRNWTPEKNAKWEWGHRVSLLVALGVQRPPPGQMHHAGDPQVSLSLRRLRENIIDVAAQADWQSPLVFGLAPLALIGAANRRAAVWLWLMVGYLFLQWWLLTHRLDRFWVPLVPIASVLAGAGAVWDSGRVWRVTAATIVACSVFFNFSFCTTPLCGDNRYAAVLVAHRDPIDATVNWMNENLPGNAKLLAVGAADLFHLDRPVVYNTVFDDCIFERLVSGRDKVAENLKRHGITHVYVNWREIGRYRAPGSYGYTDFVQPEIFRELVDAGILRRAQTFGTRLDDESERGPAGDLFVVLAESAL